MDIRTFRKHRRLSQREFGGLLDPPVTQGMVGHWESGLGRVTAERAKQIEDATGGLVTRHELRPDIFDAPVAAVSA
jgi:DNA-binding transcriptional regulator YdaS (Cro superfamily)